MVSIKKMTRGKKTYYYLRFHTAKLEKQRYIGQKIPKNIIYLKREFMQEVQSELWKLKFDQIKKQYLAYNKKVPKSIIEQRLAEFSYYFTHDTQKIEGSSLTEQETVNLLRFHITPDKKPEADMFEAQSHHMVFMKIMSQNQKITPKNILSWHREIFEKTKPDIAGKIRTYPVLIRGSKTTFPHADFVPAFLKQFFKWYDKSKTKIHPVELAGLAHFRFVTIHPFGDGNGRISRLVMNKILFENDFPLLNIKYTERKFYYSALEKSATMSDENYFLKWFACHYIRKSAANLHI
ncbi:MAG: Fic family protein [Nitrosotalea sp.]